MGHLTRQGCPASLFLPSAGEGWCWRPPTKKGVEMTTTMMMSWPAQSSLASLHPHQKGQKSGRKERTFFSVYPYFHFYLPGRQGEGPKRSERWGKSSSHTAKEEMGKKSRQHFFPHPFPFSSVETRCPNSSFLTAPELRPRLNWHAIEAGQKVAPSCW